MNFESVAVTAVQDLWQVGKVADSRSTKPIKVKRFVINATNTTIPTSQMLAIRVRILPATVTDGSGGTSVTAPAKTDLGDSSAGFTGFTNNTTKATTSGTATILFEGGFHIFNGMDETLDMDGKGGSQTTIPTAEVVVIELLSTVSGTVNLSGTCWVEESGG